MGAVLGWPPTVTDQQSLWQLQAAAAGWADLKGEADTGLDTADVDALSALLEKAQSEET